MIEVGQVFIFQNAVKPEIIIITSKEMSFFSSIGHRFFNLTLQKFEWDETSSLKKKNYIKG